MPHDPRAPVPSVPVTPSTVTSADGTTLRVDTRGEGPGVVLVSGALTDRSTWGDLPDRLAGTFTVVTYDRRGRGASGDTLPYAPEREVEDLLAVLGSVGEPPACYGHSSGAILALWAAALGGPIRRLACYEPPLRPADEDAAQRQHLSERITALLDTGARDEAVATFLLEGFGTPPEVVERAKERPTWQALRDLASTIPYDLALAGAHRGGTGFDLGAISVPTFVLDGGSSPERMRSLAKAVVAAVPGARGGTLVDERHNPTPYAITRVLKGFFTAPWVDPASAPTT
jgi:hypothetical protein